MAAPTYQSVASNIGSFAGGSNETLTVNKPTGVVAGDLMVFFASTNDANGNVEFPGDWTRFQNLNTSEGNEIGAAWKIAGGSEGASYNVICDFATWIGGAIVRVSGHDSSTPIQGSDAKLHTNGTNLVTSHSFDTAVTTTTDNLLFFYQSDDRDAVNNTTLQSFGSDSMTEIVDAQNATGSGWHHSLAYGPKAVGASITSSSCTSNSASRATALLVAIAPQALSGGNFFMGANF